MKKIFFFTFLSLSLSCIAQDSLRTDTISFSGPQATEVSAQAVDVGNVTKIQADSAYVRGNYAIAAQLYEALLEKGESATVYYNLGNSYYKAGEMARAILNYERALLLQPGDSDIRANLEVAQAKTIDKVEAESEIFYVSWLNGLINTMNVDAWAIGGIVFFLFFLGAICIFIFSKRVIWKKIGLFSGLAFFAMAVLANVFASRQKTRLMAKDYAIVMSPSATVHSTPSENGTTLFVVHEGLKVYVTDRSMRGWTEIRLGDGKVGWIPASHIELI